MIYILCCLTFLKVHSPTLHVLMGVREIAVKDFKISTCDITTYQGGINFKVTCSGSQARIKIFTNFSQTLWRVSAYVRHRWGHPLASRGQEAWANACPTPNFLRQTPGLVSRNLHFKAPLSQLTFVRIEVENTYSKEQLVLHTVSPTQDCRVEESFCDPSTSCSEPCSSLPGFKLASCSFIKSLLQMGKS